MKKVIGTIIGIVALLSVGVILSFLSSVLAFFINLTTISPDVPFFIQPTIKVIVTLITHSLVWIVSLLTGIDGRLKIILTEVIAIILSIVIGFLVEFIFHVGIAFLVLIIILILTTIIFTWTLVKFFKSRQTKLKKSEYDMNKSQ